MACLWHAALPLKRDTTMKNNQRGNAKAVFGPNGNLLTAADLPLLNNQRWVANTKAELLAAVRGGLLTLNEACERYGITTEEYFAWRDAMARFGIAGLHEKNVQTKRRKTPR